MRQVRVDVADRGSGFDKAEPGRRHVRAEQRGHLRPACQGPQMAETLVRG